MSSHDDDKGYREKNNYAIVGNYVNVARRMIQDKVIKGDDRRQSDKDETK